MVQEAKRKRTAPAREAKAAKVGGSVPDRVTGTESKTYDRAKESRKAAASAANVTERVAAQPAGVGG